MGRFMFYGATSFNQNLDKWDVSQVKDMTYMFYGATSFDHDLDKWDVSSVTNMKMMFYKATSFNQELCWNLSHIEDEGKISDMFTNTKGGKICCDGDDCE